MKRLVLGFVVVMAAGLPAGCVSTPQHEEAEHELGVAAKRQAMLATFARPIVLIGHSVSAPNHAGGVDLRIDFQNTSAQPLKYVKFDFTVLNSVGDAAPCEVSGSASGRVGVVGPVPSGYIGGQSWEAVIYNPVASFLRIDRVEVTFMSGEVESLDAARVAAIQVRPENNDFTAGWQQRFTLTAVGDRMVVARRWR